MKVSQATKYCLDYHAQNSKKNTAVNYQVFLARFNEQFGERELQTITSEEILTFLTQLSENTRQTTKRHRLFPPQCLLQLNQEHYRQYDPKSL